MIYLDYLLKEKNLTINQLEKMKIMNLNLKSVDYQILKKANMEAYECIYIYVKSFNFSWITHFF